MITEDYVSFETAKLLKKKGFDNEVKSFYSYDSEFKTWELEEDDRWDTPNNWGSYYYSAPTCQMAMKWLREKHKIFIQVELYSKYGDYYFDLFQSTYRLVLEKFVVYNTYEQAVEAAIKYCLENVI